MQLEVTAWLMDLGEKLYAVTANRVFSNLGGGRWVELKEGLGQMPPDGWSKAKAEDGADPEIIGWKKHLRPSSPPTTPAWQQPGSIQPAQTLQTLSF